MNKLDGMDRASRNSSEGHTLDPSAVSKSSLCIRHSQAFGALLYSGFSQHLHGPWDKLVHVRYEDVEVDGLGQFDNYDNNHHLPRTHTLQDH